MKKKHYNEKENQALKTATKGAKKKISSDKYTQERRHTFISSF